MVNGVIVPRGQRSRTEATETMRTTEDTEITEGHGKSGRGTRGCTRIRIHVRPRDLRPLSVYLRELRVSVVGIFSALSVSPVSSHSVVARGLSNCHDAARQNWFEAENTSL